MPKTAKTILGTTEKSNFILNMTPESYYSFNLKILLGFLILMPLFSIPLEFAKVYSVPGMALSIMGVFAIVFVFIGFMKSETPRNLLLPAGITSLASIYYKDENSLLDQTDDVDAAYMEKILPDKMKWNLRGLLEYSFFGDIKLMFMTFFAACGKEYRIIK